MLFSSVKCVDPVFCVWKNGNYNCKRDDKLVSQEEDQLV